MKTMAKRLLALALSAALLIGCAISGLVLPAAAQNTLVEGENLITNGDFESSDWDVDTHIVSNKGYDTSRGFEITGSTKPKVNFKLKEPLTPGNFYVFRFKAKGGMAYLWHNSSLAFMNLTPQSWLSSGDDRTKFNTNDWIQYQTHPFQPTAEITELNAGEINLMKSSVPEVSSLVYDDFEIVKYEPGINLVPASNGNSLPFIGGGVAGTFHIFYNLIPKASSFSLADDGYGNSAWKFADLPNGKYNLRLQNCMKLITLGEYAQISFRYKSTDGTDVTVTPKEGDLRYSKITKVTPVDSGNGWTTVTALMKIVGDANNKTDYSYQLALEFEGSTNVLIDDFSIAETALIDIEQTTVSVQEGQTEPLSVTMEPSGTPVTWKSSDDETATVDQNGVVTGHKPGTVIITATARGGNADTCTVTVTEKPSVNIMETTASVQEGKTLTLHSTITPSGTEVTWSSSDSTTASVNQNGEVTAHKVGKVTITATVAGGVSDACEVTVTAKPTVSITEESVSVESGLFLPLTYSTVPVGSAVTWTSTDDTVATAVDGVIAALKPGTVTITATVDGGNFDTCTVTVTRVSAGKNLIANGDFEGNEWTGDTIVEGEGFDGVGNSFRVVKNCTRLPANIRLKQSLETDKWYFLRFKAKGGIAKIYADNSLYSFMNLAPNRTDKDEETDEILFTTKPVQQNVGTDKGWIEYQCAPFKPTAEQAALLSWDKGGIYFYACDIQGEGTPIYYDDFELVEYIPGRNFMPGSDGTALPYAASGGGYHLFYPSLNQGMTMSLDNGAWKLSDLGGENAGIPRLGSICGSFIATNEKIKFSLRYKGDGASVTISSANKDNSVVAYEKVTKNNDGWTAYEAHVTLLNSGQIDSAVYWNLTGADTIWIDDFFVSELIEVDITKGTVSVEEGQAAFIPHTVTENGAPINWTSSDPAIATVKDGVVNGVTVGTVTITATTISGMTDTCQVSVTPLQNVFPDAGFEKGTDFGFAIEQGVGLNGSSALVIPAGTSNKKIKNVTLREPLKAGGTYLLRYKVKGGYPSALWVDTTGIGTTVHGVSLPSLKAIPSAVETEFVQVQYTFVSANDTATLNGFAFFNSHASQTTYLDDFEIYEYKPGMNLYPDDEDCAALAVTNSSGGGPFAQFLNIAGVTVTDAKDGTNNVIKLAGLHATGETAAILPLSRFSNNVSMLGTDRDVIFSFRYKGVDSTAATAVLASASSSVSKAVGKPTTTAPDADGWRTHTARFKLWQVDSGGTVRLHINGATEIMIDDLYFGESTNLSVSDLTWTSGDTQLQTGTDLQFSVKVSNNGTEDLPAESDVFVNFVANKGETPISLGTLVHKGGLKAGETVTLTTAPWRTLAGEWVVSAHVTSTYGKVEKVATQGHFRVADTFLTAPNEALSGGFNTLAFSDEFDIANVDTEYTGDYGYKWYLTDLKGISGDKTDYFITDGVMTLAAKNMRYNWLMATMDGYTAAGWHGFKYGYLEFRTRFGNQKSENATDKCRAPAVWSFPPEVIASSALKKPDRYVEMDWMEYWADDANKCKWTITLHDETFEGYDKVNSVNNRGSNHILDPQYNIGDGQWHTLGFRWEKGLLIAYLDGKEIFYQDWSENGHYPASEAPIGQILDDAFTPLDNQLSPLILAGSEGWPMEIDYIRVWQKDEEAPHKFPVDNAETPVTDLYWAPNTSSATPLAGNKTLCWRTDDPMVASVADGVIHTHREGRALITAYSAEKAVAQYAVTVDRYGERLPFGDFEIAANDTHKTWLHGDSTCILVANGKGSIVTESDGNRALTLPAGKSGYLNNANLEAGKTYRLSGRVKGSAGATMFGFYGLNIYDYASQSGEKKPISSSQAGQWVDFSYTFTTTNVTNGAYKLEKSYSLSLRNSGSSAAYFDNLSLVETDGFVVQGINQTFEIHKNTKNSIFNTCFGPSVSVADYNLTLQSHDTSILAQTSITRLTAKAFGSAYVTVTATHTSSGQTLTKTVKVSVVSAVGAAGMSLLTTPHATVKLQNTNGNPLTSFTAGNTVRVKLNVEEGYLPVAGSLRFTTASGAVRSIKNRNQADTTGNTFEIITVPSGKFDVSMATQSAAQTNFSFGTIGTGIHYQSGTDKIDGVRFLTRLHIDGGVQYNGAGRLVLTYNGTQYVVKEMGSLLKRVSNTAKLTLENARDTQYGNATSGNKKIWQTTAYKTGDALVRAFDETDGYIDFTVSMLTKTPSDAFNNRRYEVRGYIEFERADGTTFTVHSDSFVDSTVQAIARETV